MQTGRSVFFLVPSKLRHQPQRPQKNDSLRLGSLRSAVALTLSLGSLGGLGCASIPQGTAAVDAVSVEGADAISSSDVEG